MPVKVMVSFPAEFLAEVDRIADTFEELGPMIEEAMRAWIESALEDGQPVPEPRPAVTYSED